MTIKTLWLRKVDAPRNSNLFHFQILHSIHHLRVLGRVATSDSHLFGIDMPQSPSHPLTLTVMIEGPQSPFGNFY